jgi:hypothetical protein
MINRASRVAMPSAVRGVVNHQLETTLLSRDENESKEIGGAPDVRVGQPSPQRCSRDCSDREVVQYSPSDAADQRGVFPSFQLSLDVVWELWLVPAPHSSGTVEISAFDGVDQLVHGGAPLREHRTNWTITKRSKIPLLQGSK